MKPDHTVLSEPTEVQGPVLSQITAGILDRLGIKLDRAAAGAPASSPRQPRREFPTQITLERADAPIKDRLAVSMPEAAQAVVRKNSVRGEVPRDLAIVWARIRVSKVVPWSGGRPGRLETWGNYRGEEYRTPQQ
jgi:hypothetical protein